LLSEGGSAFAGSAGGGTATAGGGGGIAFPSSFSFFYLNLRNDSSTISSVKPFLLRKIRFCVSDTFSRSFPKRKMVAIEISFYFSYSFFSYSSYFCFFFASVLPM
jgi:hypothetical protein